MTTETTNTQETENNNENFGIFLYDVENAIVDYCANTLDLRLNYNIFRMADWPMGLVDDNPNFTQSTIVLTGGSILTPNTFPTLPIGQVVSGNIIIRGSNDKEVCRMCGEFMRIIHGCNKTCIPTVAKIWATAFPERRRVILANNDEIHAGENMIGFEMNIPINVAFS